MAPKAAAGAVHTAARSPLLYPVSLFRYTPTVLSRRRLTPRPMPIPINTFRRLLDWESNVTRVILGHSIAVSAPPLLNTRASAEERIEFLSLLADVGVQSVKLPPQSPNLNAVAERFVRSIKESCLDRLILFGEAGLRKAVQNFILHYHAERNHQGKGNQLLFPGAAEFPEQGTVSLSGAIRWAPQVLSPTSGMRIGRQPIQ